tara:strand:- start:21 stop:419 length:399 start_codon:yes stop_codon:yes gene_type:complete
MYYLGHPATDKLKTTLNSMKNEITRNIGSNRGNRRVWIEGKSLEQLGWTKGVRYTRKTDGAGFTLERDESGKLKVAGGEGRPVLDLCGAYVGKALDGYNEVSVTITANKISITGKAAAILFPIICKALEVAA